MALELNFKINFKISDYEDILPNRRNYLIDDIVMNADEWERENYEECYWKKHVATKEQINSPDYVQREVKRIIRTGVWIAIKEELLWIPPNYYFFLMYFNTGGAAPQFRIKMLKYLYFKIRARNNSKCIGTMTIKQRQEGLTTIEMSNALWEMAIGLMDYGQIGIQSKSRDTVKLSCWRTLKMGWQMLPFWIKKILYKDFASNGAIEETMKFSSPATPDDKGRDILISFGASVHNAFDSFNNMRHCIFDEYAKWPISLYKTFLNYKNFIIPGGERKGLFTMISSPADTNGTHNDEALALWKESEYDEETKTSRSGIFRYYMNPLDGMDGYYDKFGDADPVFLKKKILDDRFNIPDEFKLSQIRAFPLSEEEMFGSTEGSHAWSNHKGILERKIFLIGRRFKDENTQEPCVVYGNLEFLDGYMYNDVVFRQSDKNSYDLKDARFCFSYLPKFDDILEDSRKPPLYVEGCLGVDPFNLRYPAKHVGKQSNAAMVNRVFRDVNNRGYNKCPTMVYCCRVQHQETFFSDCIKAAIFNRSLIQYENRSDKLSNWAEDNGYFDWLLPEIGASAGSMRKGDAPGGGRNAFLEEGMGLINANTNIPRIAGEPYLLDNYWHIDLLSDYLEFDPLDTHANDISMADIQSLVGIIKILNIKRRSAASPEFAEAFKNSFG